MSITDLKQLQKEVNTPTPLLSSCYVLVSGGMGCNFSIIKPTKPHFGMVYCQSEPIFYSELI